MLYSQRAFQWHGQKRLRSACTEKQSDKEPLFPHKAFMPCSSKRNHWLLQSKWPDEKVIDLHLQWLPNQYNWFSCNAAQENWEVWCKQSIMMYTIMNHDPVHCSKVTKQQKGRRLWEHIFFFIFVLLWVLQSSKFTRQALY